MPLGLSTKLLPLIIIFKLQDYPHTIREKLNHLNELPGKNAGSQPVAKLLSRFTGSTYVYIYRATTARLSMATSNL